MSSCDWELIRFIDAIRSSHPDIVALYTQGRCYDFFLIIRAIRPTAIAYYDHAEGHVYSLVGGRLYDIRGVSPRVPEKWRFLEPLTYRGGHPPHRWGRGDRRRLVDPRNEKAPVP